jgi:predicted dehydrogenase
VNDVRLGVIGLGVMGTTHAMTVAEGRVSGLRLTAVANGEPSDPRWAPPVSCYNSAEALIDSGRVDAILVATPHPSHKDLCIRALKAGLHIMVEKPVSIHKRGSHLSGANQGHSGNGGDVSAKNQSDIPGDPEYRSSTGAR